MIIIIIIENLYIYKYLITTCKQVSTFITYNTCIL